ncbi:hypothetical protein ACFRCX_30690 [Streptomyces sp. NPDC056652]|uniref:hypothetical protein n=1 Tax=Streptomyces sp. NPDC056652 TaxID=3345893 RepID=UPI0036BD81A8
MLELADALIETKLSAVRSWYLAVRDRYPSALVPAANASPTSPEAGPHRSTPETATYDRPA